MSQYKNVTAEIFANFEPWHCGDPCAVYGYLQEGGTSVNKFHRYLGNGFAPSVTVNGYKINGETVLGTQLGTLPKAGSGHELFYSNNGSREISIYKSNNDIYVGSTKLDYSSVSSVCPLRLGILIVGAGGGAGGHTWYDPEKNGKSSDQYCCCGTGGGGAGTIWGVINLEKTSSSKRYWIRRGTGGAAGSNADTGGLSHNNPKKGGNGGAGSATIIGLGTSSSQALDTSWNSSNETGVLVNANGGSGGTYGYWSGGVDGGAGARPGTYVSGTNCFWYVGGASGKNGCSCNPDADTATESISITISFMQDDSGNGSFSWTNSHDVGHVYRTRDTSAYAPGGNSLGRGANKAIDNNVGPGGGGCSCSNGGPRNGGDGQFWLFY